MQQLSAVNEAARATLMYDDRAVSAEVFYPPSWMARGACAGDNAAVMDAAFDLAPTPSKKSERVFAAAREVCAGCPVIEECREFQLRLEGDTAATYRYGFFGGLSPVERHALSVGGVA